MNILKEINNKLKGAEGRIREEIIYAAVMKEIKSGTKREGLWAKALSESEGNKAKTESLYIKYRVQSIEDELQVEEEEREAIEAKKSERVTEANKKTKRIKENKEAIRRRRIFEEASFFEIWLPRILIISPYIAIYFLWDYVKYYLKAYFSKLSTQSEFPGFIDLLFDIMLGNFFIVLFPIILWFLYTLLVAHLCGYDSEDRDDISAIGFGFLTIYLIGFFVFPWPLILWLFR